MVLCTSAHSIQKNKQHPPKEQKHKKRLHLRLCGEKSSVVIIRFALICIFPCEKLSKASDTWVKRPQSPRLYSGWSLAHNFRFSILRGTALPQAIFQHILCFKHNFSICSLTSESSEQPAPDLCPNLSWVSRRDFPKETLGFSRKSHVATVVSSCIKCAYPFPCAMENVVVAAFQGKLGHWHDGNVFI